MTGGPESLISVLAADLRPVRRLPRPAVRAALWCAAVAGLAIVLAPLGDERALAGRLAAAPDLWWATFGSVLTAITAAVATFQMSVPGRARAWALLPAGPTLLWLGASGLGCLRGWGLPGVEPATMGDAMGCATFILLVSVPLSALLIFMLRRACPLWPGPMSAMGGLAAAAAAASLLTLFHPHDASAIDLLMHVVAVSFVVGATRWAGA